MDKLKNKSFKNYDYITRYSKFPYYYNTLDDKYIYGITENLSKATKPIITKLYQQAQAENANNGGNGGADDSTININPDDIK